MVKSKNTYWQNIWITFHTLLAGMKLSFRHMLDARERRYPLGADDATYFDQDTGIFTIRYPHEMMPIPDNGRYKLHNEIDDCIVCDKCAKICPVDCIEIEPIKSVTAFGKTSDGTPKRIYAAKFDIDMAKCCFCGLCTTVCPTECLTMTKEFDFSEYDVSEHLFSFGNMSPELVKEKKDEWDDFQKTKETSDSQLREEGLQKPMGMRPIIKKPGSIQTENAQETKKPFKPMMKPKMPSSTGASGDQVKPIRPKPVIKTMKQDISGPGDTSKKTKPVIKPKMNIRKKEDGSEGKNSGS